MPETTPVVDDFEAISRVMRGATKARYQGTRTERAAAICEQWGEDCHNWCCEWCVTEAEKDIANDRGRA